MFSITDSIVLALTLYFLYRGWSQGLLRTLAGPIALIVGCLGAFIYYAQTRNIIVAFIISIAAPLILNIFFSLALAVWHKMTKTENPISPLSRFLGASICALWGGINILLFIVLVALIPLNTSWIERIRQDIFNSVTYSLADQWTKRLVPGKSIDIRSVSQVLKNPEQMQNLQSSAEYKAAWEDKTLQKLLADEEIMRDIRNKNFAKLLANPKMQAMMKDPALVKKILDLNIKIMGQNTRPTDEQE
ncbi:MAG: CvpA family protein [Candidatus Omnitrophica bacterium]|nr:CvpA family protein [Candidatus Omnitrophota bacterium]